MVAKTETSTRRRQPRGIPVGGEFASNEHDEADSALTETTTTRRGTVLEVKKNLTPEEMVEEARKSISVYAARRNLTRDMEEETLQNVSLELTQTYIAKGKQLDGAVVNYVANLHAKKALGDHRGKPLVGANAMAYTDFRDTVEELEKTRGTELSATEKDEIAGEIIDNWHDRKHKPTRGFHNYYNRETSIDSIPGSYDGDDYVHPALIDPYSPEAALAEGGVNTAADAVLERMERADSIKERNAIAREARENAWGILSNHRDVPPVKAKLSEARRKTILSHINSAGGAAAVAERYERGESDSATEALFMPFRENVQTPDGRIGWRKLNDAQMDAISDMLRSDRRRADVLWASALASAK